MSTAVLKLETETDTCSVCGGGGELLTPEEHDAGAPFMQTPLRAMLLQLNNNKVIPEGRLCTSCIRRAIEAYEFSNVLSSKGSPPLSEKIRALRQKLHELTQKIDVFIVVGGPGVNSGGSYSEDDIIMVERDALAAAAAADDEDLERARNACGDTVYQCTVCPMSFQRANEFRAHQASHPANSRHSCWTCGSQFTTRAALKEHSVQHNATTDLVCNICSNVFQNLSDLRVHEATCCAVCPACGAAAGGRAELSAHVRRHHSAPPATLLCAACFLPAANVRQLSAHRLTHRRADRFLCGYDACILRFANRLGRGTYSFKFLNAVLPAANVRQLSAHRLTHRRADRFLCGYDACILRFANRGDLMAHIRKCHSGELPQFEPQQQQQPPPPASTSCPHCPRTFGSVAAMKRHVRVHRRDKQQDTEWRMDIEALDGLTGEGDVEYLEMEALEELDDRD